MKIAEYIEYLNLNDYLIESEEFTDGEWAHLGRHVEPNGLANTKAGRDNPIYKDDKTYNDYQGLKWVDVKKRDEYTIASAFVDGVIDAMRTSEEDEAIEDDIDLNNIVYSLYLVRTERYYKSARNLEDLMTIIIEKLDKFEVYESVIKFLQRYMHGHVTVYRGFEFTADKYDELTKNIDTRKVSNILQVLNNKTKQFNSFSTSPMMASSFSNGWADGSKKKSVVIAAEVEPNDINFAFTAYLMGRHDGVGESELNINNLKDLKNLRVITDIQRECKIARNRLPSISDLQKSLNAGEEVFDRTVDVSDYDNNDYIIGNINGFSVLMDTNNHILTDYFAGHVGTIYDKYVTIPCIDKRGFYKLYKFNSGYVTDEFRSMECRNAKASGMIIIKFGEYNYQLFDITKSRCIFKNPMRMIWTLPTAFPSTWFMVNTPNGKQTIIDNNGKPVFIGATAIFDRVKHKYGTVEFECEIGDRTKTYKLKNDKLVEVLG